MKLGATPRNIDDMTPVLIGRRWWFADGSRVALVAGAADGDPIIIPEAIGDVTDEDLAALEAQVVEEIDAMLDAGSDDLETMTALAEGLEKIRAENTRRDEQAETRKAEIEALRQRVHPVATDDGDSDDDGDDGDDPGDGDAPAGDGGEGATGDKAGEKVLVAASGPNRATRRAAAASAKGTARRTARPTVPDAKTRVTITAAADLPDVTSGSVIDLTQVAQSMHDRARSMSDMGPRAPIARLHLGYSAENTVGKMTSNEGALEIIDRLSNPKDLLVNGLVAAGGWCTPSQNLYDLLQLDSTSGLLDLPSVGVDRGGLNIPSYIGIDAADGALWTWGEDQDAAPVVTVSDLDVVSGVGTMTSTGNHLLQVGDLVNLRVSNSLMNGPHTVTAVADATHATLNMTGVPDAANATGFADRQKGCFTIPCPTWSDTRLGAYGLCIKHGNLSDRAFPELTRRYVGLVLNAHQHRMSAVKLAKIASSVHSDAVTVTTTGSDSWGELMSAIELSIVDYRSQYKIGDNVVLECLMPSWIRENLRANLAMRAGVDNMLSVTDAQIDAAFTVRNVRPQFLEDYKPMWNGSARATWPTTSEFIIFPAGGIIEGNGGTIDLGVLRDSRLNATNDFTAAWSEEFNLVARRGPKARKVTHVLDTNGITACCP